MNAARRGVRAFTGADTNLPPQGARSAITDYVDQKDDSAFAAGMVVFQNCKFEWRLWYDEILFCHRVDGLFAVTVQGSRYQLEPGDALWLPRATTITYESEGRSWLFFAVAPANWRETRPPDVQPPGSGTSRWVRARS